MSSEIIAAAIMICLCIFILYRIFGHRREAFDLYYDSMPNDIPIPRIKYAAHVDPRQGEGSNAFVVIGDMVLTWGWTTTPVVVFSSNMSIPFKEAHGALACPGFPSFDSNVSFSSGGDVESSIDTDSPRVYTGTVTNLGPWGFVLANLTSLEYPVYFLAWGSLDPKKYHGDSTPPEDIRNASQANKKKLEKLSTPIKKSKDKSLLKRLYSSLQNPKERKLDVF